MTHETSQPCSQPRPHGANHNSCPDTLDLDEPIRGEVGEGVDDHVAERKNGNEVVGDVVGFGDGDGDRGDDDPAHAHDEGK